MLPYVLGALLLSALSVSADDKHQCYWRRMDQTVIKDNLGWFQCNNTETHAGGAQLCCKNGDRCGDDSICHSDKVSNSQSAWYIGGCSDGSYEDPVCRKDCSKFKQTYIEWNGSEKEWDCCGNYNCKSDREPSNVSFSAVSPAEWEPRPQKGRFTPDYDDDGSSNDGGIELSTAAKAGIGVGAGVAVIAVIALITVCCIRRKRPAERKQFGNGKKGTYERLGPQHEMAPFQQPTPYTGASGQGMPRSRDPSPAPASRGVSPARAPMMSNYGGVEPPAYPDKAGQRSTDDGA